MKKYSIKGYKESFSSVEALVEWVLEKGIDPSAMVYYKGKSTKTRVQELIIA